MKRLLLIAALAAVALLAGLLLYTEVISPAKPRLTAQVDSLAPRQLSGWRVRDVPMAENDGQLQVVKETLKYDGVLQRAYEKPGLTVLVYAAYWTPGKTTPFDAGTHNPDSCWCGSGWKQLERKNGVAGDIAGRALRPYEYGVYELGVTRTPVIFWHLVNGEPNRYEGQNLGWTGGWAGKAERLNLVLKDLKNYGLNQKQEQVFIRISITGLPIAVALRDPDFIRLMNSLEGLGIFTDRTWR